MTADDTLNPPICRPPIPALDPIGHALLWIGVVALLMLVVWVVLALRFRAPFSAVGAWLLGVVGVGGMLLAFALLGSRQC
ncbi:hypothetical protein EVU97_14565 [Dermacoccus sp. 147Ba]|uniref:hypothetical protein n=1 Tax=Dermacoccus sp. 147Ba TaxID=2510111 RepID=UPI00101D3DBC|nr:hypothetical protein [Dermacoccus sp. 147Ba]RYI20452.1 hypothetical protein EVU97_14565 [Dermacoccus sp. 147Ba]